MEKIKISLEDPKTRAIWAAVQQAKAEVAAWPPSMRGEDGPPAPRSREEQPARKLPTSSHE